VHEAMEAEVRARGLSGVEVRRVGCPGFCSRGPVVIVDRPTDPAVFYQAVEPADVPEILEYVPNNVYLVRVVPEAVPRVLGLPSTRAVLPLPPAFRIDPEALLESGVGPRVYGIFLLRQFFMTIPQELDDAAVKPADLVFEQIHLFLQLDDPVLLPFPLLDRVTVEERLALLFQGGGAFRTQQIIAHESGIPQIVDPLGDDHDGFT
jgi:(2Fe-2S) ferredoxin